MGPIGLTGPEGPQGPIGTMGPIGVTGPEGPIGLTGTMGPIGLTGPEGPIGLTGTMGPIGLTGPEGPEGPIGTMGPIGLTGPEGPQGPIGLTGPPFSPTFIHVDRETDQEINLEEAVIWNANQVTYGGAGHNSGESQLYIWNTGYYHVYYNLYHQEPCQFSMFKNGSVIPSTTTGSPTGSSQISGTSIILLTEADFTTPTTLSPSGFAASLEVVNHTSYAPVIHLNGLTGSGSATPQTVATVTVFKLAEVST